ncbi:hypothetical protein LO772_34225 [Yinghuangia sp. ASG 101]|uniref:DUF4286 family protein n=1 Tax=Yinghuangia sp. ASG 101 TaxID=2896848 RepID=UPI001E51206C|nr:DUF4286 family protein [Yinghuangia sp. ASG 101]UGQ11770.1 hypothetical protein LO772_34225 [Yinghuangia sp. ASG 101]
MAKGIFLVENSPCSPEREAEFNQWYDEVHLPEMCAVEGVVSARRFAGAAGEMTYVTVYELEADDLDGVRAAISAAAVNGDIHMSDSIRKDPPSRFRILRTIGEYAPDQA